MRAPRTIALIAFTALAAMMMAAAVTTVLARGLSAPSHTRQVLIEPFNTAGVLAPGFKVASRGSADCFATSISSSRAGSWRCMSKNLLYDPCFQAPNRHHTVACPLGADRPHRVKVFRVAKSLPFNDGFPPFTVWGIRLSNGASCERVTGTANEAGGKFSSFFCNRRLYSAYGPIDRSHRTWRVLTGYGLHPKLKWTNVRVAYT